MRGDSELGKDLWISEYRESGKDLWIKKFRESGKIHGCASIENLEEIWQLNGPRNNRV